MALEGTATIPFQTQSEFKWEFKSLRSAQRSSFKLGIGLGCSNTVLDIIPESIESPMTCDDVEIPNMEIFNIGSSLFRPSSIITDLLLMVSAPHSPKHSACTQVSQC